MKACNQKKRLNMDNTINNHGKHLINICKNVDLRILNGGTKGDSLDGPTFHGKNGISVVDYIICDQDTFQNVNYFVVKAPTYLTDHSQIVTWIDIPKLTKNNGEDQYQSEQTPLHKLPLQLEWSENSKNKFRQALKSPEIQMKLDHFIQSTFACDQNGVNECVTEFQSIITDASKKYLKLRKSKIRKRTTNILNKKLFDKECHFKRHELCKLAN